MKILTAIAALGLLVSCADAQKLKEADVPANVKAAITKIYPTATETEWKKEGANFEAEVEVSESKEETSVLIDPAGKVLETEIEISVNQLPKAVAEYVTKNLEGKKIKEASKITDANGVVTYEAEVEKTDYIFDSNGNFVKQDKEKDKEDDKNEKED